MEMTLKGTAHSVVVLLMKELVELTTCMPGLYLTSLGGEVPTRNIIFHH